jgi:hypothetical protein
MSAAKRRKSMDGNDVNDYCGDCELMAAQYIYSSDEDRFWTKSVFKESISDLNASAKKGCITCNFFSELIGLSLLEIPTSKLQIGMKLQSGKTYERASQGNFLEITIPVSSSRHMDGSRGSEALRSASSLLSVEILTKGNVLVSEKI